MFGGKRNKMSRKRSRLYAKIPNPNENITMTSWNKVLAETVRKMQISHRKPGQSFHVSVKPVNLQICEKNHYFNKFPSYVFTYLKIECNGKYFNVPPPKSLKNRQNESKMNNFSQFA